MDDEASKRHATAWFAAHQFEVEPIPPAEPSKRADLKAKWKREQYAVEAKGKSETSFSRELVSAARERGVATDTLRVSPSNTVSGVIKEAYAQLQATPLSDSTFRVLWVLAAQGDGAFVLEAFEKRLFGLESLSCITLDQKGNALIHSPPDVRRCYFHGHSDFARFSDLDAAVLSTGGNGFLCVNPVSPRREALRCSRLHQIFQAHRAVRDPEVEDRGGEALFIDSPVRRDGQREFLKRKYKLGTSAMVDSRFSGLLVIDLENLNGR